MAEILTLSFVLEFCLLLNILMSNIFVLETFPKFSAAVRYSQYCSCVHHNGIVLLLIVFHVFVINA